MTWVKLDDGFPDHPKVEALSDGAFRAWVTVLCYCARQLTDGLCSSTMLRKLGVRPKHEAELVQAGLWHRLQTGAVVVHDYLEYNPTRAKVQANREAAADRMKRHRTKDDKPECSREQDTNFARSSEDVRVPRPVPSPEENVTPGGVTTRAASVKKSRRKPRLPYPEAFESKHLPGLLEYAATKGWPEWWVRDRLALQREKAAANDWRYVDWTSAAQTFLRQEAEEYGRGPEALKAMRERPVNGKPPGAQDHEARRIEANTRHEHRAWLLEQASSGAFGPKAQAAAESGQIDRLEAWYEQQRGRRAAGASGSGSPAQIGGLLQAALGGREASNAR